MLSLLDLEVGHQFFILRHQFAMNLSLLPHSALQHLDLLSQRSYVIFILLYEGSDRMSTEQLCKAIICHFNTISHFIFVLSGGKSSIDNVIDLRLLTGQ